MAVAALTEARTRTEEFHATMLVTRAEEWCEAESAEEARQLLATGAGYR
jgi:hypothetical protein